MIRNAIVFFLCLFGAFFVVLYVVYNEFDPCRALAIERARHAPVQTTAAKVWTTIDSARMDRLTCTKSLLAAWRAHLTD